MRKIHVTLDRQSYDIIIGKGAVARLSVFIKRAGFTGPLVVIIDKKIASKKSGSLYRVLGSLPNKKIFIKIDGSERSKSIATYHKTISDISRRSGMFKPLIVAVGGGVTGDLAGFVAATYRRGVPFIQVPTTLLAQVDSSIGGKTGIDIPEAKNIIGSFKQPQAVFIDTEFLMTLPKRQVANGLAEVIKYGVINSRSLFMQLEKRMKDILALDLELLEKIIYSSALIKAEVVQRDEFDCKDMRIFLNFGHTFGHAVEAAGAFSARYNHGEAVAIGMLMASELAVMMGLIRAPELGRLKKIIIAAGLPDHASGVSRAKVLKALKYDKKFTGGANRFILPVNIGLVKVFENIPDVLIMDIIKKYIR
jgi:3-dehydroquinate synthase